MTIKSMNHKLYTDLPIDELDRRLQIEDLETRLELDCWTDICYIFYGECTVNYCPTRCDRNG